MPQTREQINELKNSAKIVIKQLFKEPYFIEQITDSMSNEIAKSVKQQLDTFEKKVDELKSNIHDVEIEHGKVVKKLNDKIDLLSAKVNDSSVAFQNPIQIISEITEIKQQENNIIMFGIPEDDTDQDAIVKDVVKIIIPDFEMTGSKIHRLGKPSAGKTRPLKIIMPTSSKHSQLIRNNKKIQAVDRFRDVYIKPDQTVMQRELFIRLRQELRERQESDSTEVGYIIANLTDSTALDVNGLSNKMLKNMKEGLAEPLTKIINKCFETGVPDECKNGLALVCLKGTAADWGSITEDSFTTHEDFENASKDRFLGCGKTARTFSGAHLW
ncbi:hypothetical protein JTB14_019897 [Gonioctena quinquepunctata]|nr:hypothetical protein JTB14_019897 [Gonioctena quinquepunctata]